MWKFSLRRTSAALWGGGEGAQGGDNMLAVTVGRERQAGSGPCREPLCRDRKTDQGGSAVTCHSSGGPAAAPGWDRGGHWTWTGQTLRSFRKY